MKKVLLLAAVAVFGLSSVNAQEFKGGVNVGLPGGDFFGLSIGADVNYLWEVGDGFEAGVMAGYQHFLGKTVTFFGESITQPGIGIIPIGGAARYSVSDELALGVDLGYSFAASGGGGGSAFFAPRAQYSLSDSLDAVVSFKSFGTGFTTINLGVEIGL